MARKAVLASLVLFLCCLESALCDTYIVDCETTKGKFSIEVLPDWSPNGAKRFLHMVAGGFFNQAKVPMFRVVKSFLVQFGISSIPSVTRQWAALGSIPDDPNLNVPFDEGMVAFAGGGKNSRTTQLFVTYNHIPSLGKSSWETPIGKVISGMSVLKNLEEVGDIPPWGKGPDPSRISIEGDAYLQTKYPKIDYIESCRVARTTSDGQGKFDFPTTSPSGDRKQKKKPLAPPVVVSGFRPGREPKKQSAPPQKNVAAPAPARRVEPHPEQSHLLKLDFHFDPLKQAARLSASLWALLLVVSLLGLLAVSCVGVTRTERRERSSKEKV